MRKKYIGYYRSPKTTNERRQSQNSKYVRAKRNYNNLPNTYWDIPCNSWRNKSWKNKRQTQYYTDGRGKKNTYFIKSKNRWINISWVIKEYFEKHEIPFNVEDKYKIHKVVKTRTVTTERVKSHQVPVYIQWGVNRHQIGYEWIYWDKPLEKPYTITKTYYYSEYLGCEITWWSNKDIGIERIINQAGV